ncbi:Adenylyltransferase and sulfurtransferase MOCS3 [Grifola frondosa]|uniref:Needs CLA4 to survive protein 3 n=1 Tax=Grifola frondosa TaxID=5627 RepID=A0A1C7M5S2_GRIFR|nr:Adenylyltransferase and sulfurtransferase MOCS3 [Grifola frondosa]
MTSSADPTSETRLPLEDYKRYGRQMILDGFGQLKLQQASVVVVGAGGLGCPALQYLAAAGVGTIGIIDHDTVELSNLQRQILHTEARIGIPKALSAAEAIKQINSHTRVQPVIEALTPANAAALLAPYDLILDCTDNLPVRYLLSDVAIGLGRPLVSGAAQQLDGQLCTYNLPLASGSGTGGRGPCFRCLFPRPPAPDMVGSCEELGVLGAVTGVIGNLQALEAIKIITGLHGECAYSTSIRAQLMTLVDGRPSLLMYSALAMPPFRSVKLRARRPTCAACGDEGQRIGGIEEIDYVAFCGGQRTDWEAKGLVEGGGSVTRRIRAKALKTILESEKSVRILDVRPRTEFGICHLPGSINIPIKDLVANPSAHLPSDMSSVGEAHKELDTYVICRLGNDSQLAVDALRSAGVKGNVKDLVGGLRAWAREVDESFPVY